jgi:hypothetical protein
MHGSRRAELDSKAMPAFIVAASGKPRQLTPAPFDNEKHLQTFFEQHLEGLLGVRFVASEFTTGAKYAGRIDSLGLDEVGNPVIVEYKWDKSDSVINQGLFYLDWLMDHRGDFAVAVQKRLGQSVEVTWSGPRLIIVAANYTKYDSYAINQLSPNIELLRYRRYSDGFVVIENVLDPLEASSQTTVAKTPTKVLGDSPYGVVYHLEKTSPAARQAFLELRERVLALDGVDERSNQKSQITYRTTKSFVAFDFKKACVAVQFKGGDQPPVVAGVKIKDIRSYQWGYPWLCNLNTVGDVPGVFEVVKSAYEYEQ